jgi:hypothetical protein
MQILEPFEQYINAPSSEAVGPLIFNITGEIAIPDPINSCTTLNNPDQVKGKIVLIYNDNCYLEVQARNAQAAGAIGVIQHQWATTVAGRDYFLYTDAVRDDITVPIVFVNGPDGNLIRNLTANSTRVYVIMTSGDNNVWRDNGVQGIFLTVLHLVIDLGILSYALVKLIKYTLNKRTTISVAQVSLVLIILAMCAAISIRLVLLFGSFNYTDVPISVVLGAIFFPDTLLLLSSLVVSFYWFELTSRVSSVSRAWSKKLWKPFIAGGVILVVMLALIIIWVQLIRIVAVFIGIFVVYAIITLAVAIIWIIFGARLRKTLEANTAKVQKNSKVFRKLIILIILCACSLIVTRIAAALTQIASGNLLAFRTIFEIGHFSFEITAIMQVLLFSTKNKKKATSSSKSGPRSSEMGGTTLNSPLHSVESTHQSVN